MVLVIMLTGMSLAQCGGPDGGSRIVGDVLNEFDMYVGQVLDKATADANDVLSTAAGQALLAAKNFESQIAADLNKTIDNVDKSIRDTLDKFIDIEKNFKADTEEVLQQATDDTQQILNSLSWTNKNPQVNHYEPKSTALRLEDSTPVDFKIHGNWPYAYETSSLPVLTIGSKTLQPASWSTFEMDFKLPPDQLNAKANAISRVPLDLQVKYDETHQYKDIKLGHFRFEVKVLPFIPLQELTLKNTTSIDSVTTKTFNIPDDYDVNHRGYQLRSDQSCRDASKDVEHAPKDEGFTISGAAINLLYDAAGENADAYVKNVEPGMVHVSAWTRGDCFLGFNRRSGNIEFYVSVTETQRVTLAQNQVCDLLHQVVAKAPARSTNPGSGDTGHVNDGNTSSGNPTGTSSNDCKFGTFTWGNTIVVPVTRDGWALHSKLWDGTIVDFAAGNTVRNPYIAVNDKGDKIEISLSPAYSASR